ncbi:hypothetical protein ACFW2Y_08790 [Streptomyces sp. NPDC058877]|uniref:hypothetical protein n=1 Tax=Streptomyces sp. NPDC058877 TaxID=3346665 RepID=UPI0036BAE1D2
MDLGQRGRAGDDNGGGPVVVTGFKAPFARRLSPAGKGAGRVLAAERVPAESGFVHSKDRRVLTEARTAPPAPPSSCTRCSS